jgi:hypothetical protein
MSGGGRRAVTASAGTGKAPLFLETGKRYPSTSVIYSIISSWLHNYDSFIQAEQGNKQGNTLCQAWR